jgi:site-specific recombinase XerD
MILFGVPFGANIAHQNAMVKVGNPSSAAVGLGAMHAKVAAGMELKAHPHMLRHACSYALADKGHDTRAIQGWLGHRSITSTAVYTGLVPNRFNDFWRE